MHEVLEHPMVTAAVGSLVAALLGVATAAIRNLWLGADAARAAAKAEAERQAQLLMERAALAVEEQFADTAKRGLPNLGGKRKSALDAFERAGGRHADPGALLDAVIARLPGLGATGSRVHAPPAL